MFVFISIYRVFLSNKLCVYHDDEKLKCQSNIVTNKMMQEAPYSNNTLKVKPESLK